jgi:hypothetical protein
MPFLDATLRRFCSRAKSQDPSVQLQRRSYLGTGKYTTLGFRKIVRNVVSCVAKEYMATPCVMSGVAFSHAMWRVMKEDFLTNTNGMPVRSRVGLKS